jgi:hypothetical protein
MHILETAKMHRILTENLKLHKDILPFMGWNHMLNRYLLVLFICLLLSVQFLMDLGCGQEARLDPNLEGKVYEGVIPNKYINSIEFNAFEDRQEGAKKQYRSNYYYIEINVTLTNLVMKNEKISFMFYYPESERLNRNTLRMIPVPDRIDVKNIQNNKINYFLKLINFTYIGNATTKIEVIIQDQVVETIKVNGPWIGVSYDGIKYSEEFENGYDGFPQIVGNKKECNENNITYTARIKAWKNVNFDLYEYTKGEKALAMMIDRPYNSTGQWQDLEWKIEKNKNKGISSCDNVKFTPYATESL